MSFAEGDDAIEEFLADRSEPTAHARLSGRADSVQKVAFLQSLDRGESRDWTPRPTSRAIGVPEEISRAVADISEEEREAFCEKRIQNAI